MTRRFHPLPCSLLLAACTGPAAEVSNLGDLESSAAFAAPSFTDVADTSGLAAIRSGVPDFFDIHAEDYDGDGWPDVFLSDHRTVHRLAMNDRSGRFTDQALPASTAQVWSMLASDFNNDGRLDLSTNWDSATIKIYRNDDNRTFTAVAGSQSYESQANGMAWADWNADGYPDYMVSGFFGNRIYKGSPTGYTNVTASIPAIPSGFSQGSLYFADLNGDQFPDILIQPTDASGGAGIFTPTVKHSTQILFNKGVAGASAGFHPGVTNGLGDCPGPAVAFGDYDRDGDLDLFCAGSAAAGPAQPRKTLRVRLYQNQGAGTFQDVTAASGLPTGDHAVNEFGVIYMQAAFADFDNDGRLDLFWVEPLPTRIKLFQSTGTGTFQDVTAAAGLDSYRDESTRFNSRFMITDFNRDGAPDIAAMIGKQDPKVTLFKNNLPRGANWLDIVLEGTALKTAIGSKIQLYQAGHLGDPAFRVDQRQVLLAHSHRAPLEQHFSVAAGARYDIRVEFWPERTVVDVRDVATGQRLKIKQSGAATPF